MSIARLVAVFFVVLLLQSQQLFAQAFSKEEIKRWEAQAQRVTIIRDNWGIPHVYGNTDADAVFGLLYAQCEDDFKRVEMNYIEKFGRKAEVYGEKELPNDLYVRLVIDSAKAVHDYNSSPAWLVQLMNAFADGINYYLYKHPTVKPALFNRFQPWYALLWTDGSIGAISTGDITAEETGNFYLGNDSKLSSVTQKGLERLTGSNGFALAPSRTKSGNATLYINPHVTFYFRPEVHMVSEEGLNAYGAVTWGQFFIYQGFNENCGWMHTSSNVDVADMYAEKIIKTNDSLYYEYDGNLKPVTKQQMRFHVKTDNGDSVKNVITYFTGHGPVMAKRDDKLISVKSNNQSLDGLIQCWQRTKADGFETFRKTMELRANTSNNTVFADNKGNIAYWHGDFVPVRDKNYNWSKVVDGTVSATDWKGLHKLDEIVYVYNPATGFIQNCNSTPFTVSGSSSPQRSAYPPYMAPDGENFRGVNAVRLLNNSERYNIDEIIKTGYDTYLPAFAILIPALISKFESIQPTDSLFGLLKEPVGILKAWDYHTAENSVATTLAIEWAERLNPAIRKVYIEEGETDQVDGTKQFVASAAIGDLVPPLAAAVNMLIKKFGTWRIAWGELNRFQRINNDLTLSFDDDKTSYPVGFTSSQWGMLASYDSRYFPGTLKRYGRGGNSFVCAVEFGKKIKAKSLLAGGNSGDPASKHFSDQLEMYTQGRFKDVLFYKEDVLKHAEKVYHPGE